MNTQKVKVLGRRSPCSYFESGTTKKSLSFNEKFVEAGNSGEHELNITLGKNVEEFRYTSSGKSDLVITAKNPMTKFFFSGSGEQNILIFGIENATQVHRSGSASGVLKITEATPEAIRNFKGEMLRKKIATLDQERQKLQEKLNNLQ